MGFNSALKGLIMELVNTISMFLNEVSISPPHFVHNGVHCQRKSPTINNIVLFLFCGLKYLSFLYVSLFKKIILFCSQKAHCTAHLFRNTSIFVHRGYIGTKMWRSLIWCCKFTVKYAYQLLLSSRCSIVHKCYFSHFSRVSI